MVDTRGPIANCRLRHPRTPILASETHPPATACRPPNGRHAPVGTHFRQPDHSPREGHLMNIPVLAGCTLAGCAAGALGRRIANRAVHATSGPPWPELAC